MSTPVAHLVVGPVGAGKTTFATRLAAGIQAVRFDLDRWMARLYGADPRPAEGRLEWYVERRDRCLEQIWEVAADVLEAGAHVVLELGLVRRAEREAFYPRIEVADCELVIHVLDAPREVRRERVERRNRERGETFSMEVPPDFFELASDLWEPPDHGERARYDVRDA